MYILEKSTQAKMQEVFLDSLGAGGMMQALADTLDSNFQRLTETEVIVF